jgi:hypothetical protein
MRAAAAATARRETALLITQPRESALLWEAQTRSPKCVVVMAAATARRMTALLVTQSFDATLL